MKDSGARISSDRKKILIVGGVAGGASCAARARRLSEEAEITIFEKGPHISFASCGLPYYVGDVIKEEKNLLVATPELFRRRFNVTVKVRHEVLSIDRKKRAVLVKDLETGEVAEESYDALVLATGSKPFKPPVPGIDLPGIVSLRTIEDSNLIRRLIENGRVRQVAIAGGGAIGLEMAENLVKRGISVTLVEMLPQVLPALDPEMAVPLQKSLIAHGVNLCLNDGVDGFEGSEDTGVQAVITKSGKKFPCDLVLLAMGVRPDTKLAEDAGLEIGKLGGIRVDDRMRTSDDRIWAVGDAVETRDFITGEWTLMPLAGPASRQGRIAADVIMGKDSRFRGVQGTMVCKVFDITAAATGANEKVLRDSGKSTGYEKVYLHPGHHAGYYPGAKPISLKLIFSISDGQILGAQAVGQEGVDKRIDVISMAIQKGSTVFDLEEAEMCYAPQFGSAKDPVNMAGMVAANMLRGDNPIVHWENVDDSAFILDVREPFEFNQGHIEKAVNIPLSALRSKLNELPHDREIQVYCAAGQRSYYATRILSLNGFRVKNISGGWLTYNHRKVRE